MILFSVSQTLSPVVFKMSCKVCICSFYGFVHKWVGLGISRFALKFLRKTGVPQRRCTFIFEYTEIQVSQKG